MKQQFWMVQNVEDKNKLNEYLEEGWISEKIYSTNNDFLVLLSRAEEGDEVLEKKAGEYEDVTSQIIVPTEEVDAKLADGYRLIDKDHIWAKTTALIKRESKNVITVIFPDQMLPAKSSSTQGSEKDGE